MNILVAGAGYLGLPLSLALKDEGHSVKGWTASQESAAKVSGMGIEAICGDLADREIWEQQPPFEVIFYCASTSGGGVGAYEQVHGRGLGLALDSLLSTGRFYYTSSTSVYGQCDGSDVDESSPAVPQAEGSKILLEAEKKVLERGGTVLRLAGIYGPGRSVYLRKVEEGRAIIPGDGKRWINQIHRDDAFSALLFLWKNDLPGVWNVVDDDPVAIGELYRWICTKAGRPMPGPGAEEGPRKRGLTNKRVLNGKLRRAGWVPEYPTFREGYAGLIGSSERTKGDGP